jgi:hypothetical protein
MMRTMTRYRFEDSGYDSDTNHLAEPRLMKFKVEKLTEKGAWIYARGRKRFILDKAYKAYAYDTIEKAWNSYARRKAQQVTILDYQLKKARACLKRAQEPMSKFDQWMPYLLTQEQEIVENA